MEKFPKLTEYLEALHKEKNARSCGLIIYRNIDIADYFRDKLEK